MKKFTPIAAAVALVSVLSAVPAQADSFFWAINQFQTIQRLNGDTGAVVESFAVPFGSGSAASIAVVGNIGYYTLLGNTNIYGVNMTTRASLGSRTRYATATACGAAIGSRRLPRTASNLSSSFSRRPASARCSRR